MTREELLSKLKSTLIEQFELAPVRVTEDARLYEDLDLDSIDAVDLIVRMKGLLPKRISPEAFKSVRTVGDVADVIYALLEPTAPEGQKPQGE